MATPHPGRAAIGYAAVVSLLLVLGQLLLPATDEGRPVSSVLSELISWATPWTLTGWSAVAVTISAILVIALAIDTITLGGRR